MGRKISLLIVASCTCLGLLLPCVSIADLASDPWPKKLQDFPENKHTVTVGGFRVTVLDSKDQTGAGTGGGMKDIIVENMQSGVRHVEWEQCIGVRVLQFYKNWPQLEIWSRAGGGIWCRSLYRFTGKEYNFVRTDDFTEFDLKAKDKSRVTTMPGGDDPLYFVETRLD